MDTEEKLMALLEILPDESDETIDKIYDLVFAKGKQFLYDNPMSRSKKKNSKFNTNVEMYLSIRKPMPKASGPFKKKNKKRFDWRKEINNEDQL